MFTNYVKRIRNSRVYEVAKETPLDPVPLLSRHLSNDVLLKREDLQLTHSFKVRGAYNKIANLDVNIRQRGVVAASAGNHGQGVALAAARMGIKALVVMPRTTPQIKVDSVRALGAAIDLEGQDYDDACAFAKRKAHELGRTFVHPYDDGDVIAGQGTIAMEILRQYREPIDAIFVPVGGGGLIAGMGAYLKTLRPETRLIGVEPKDAACMSISLATKRRVVLDEVGLFTDGVAVRQVGEEPFRLARECVDEVVMVSVDEICSAIKNIFDESRCIAEPAGALSLAGLKRYVARHHPTDKTLIAINSGANVNFDRLRQISELADIGEQREVLLAVTIPERPGSFREFCDAIGPRSITEFNYRYASTNEAQVFVGIALGNSRSGKAALIAQLREHGYRVVDMSNNEMAKIHVRHMVGGRAYGTAQEWLYRFEFPEYPGALLRFLTRMGQRWNISLFHYRNHGAAYGKVLMGIQASPEQLQQLRTFLLDLGYPFEEEAHNPAYELFLGTIH